MLRKRSPAFRVWFVLFLGSVGTPLLALLGQEPEHVFTVHSLLELLRVSIAGAITALIALNVEKPRSRYRRDRALDHYDVRPEDRRG